MKSQKSVAELKKELAIYENKATAILAKIDKLEAQKSRLQKQYDEIMGGKRVKTKVVSRKVKSKGKVKSGRSKRGSLKILLGKVFKKEGKPLRIDEILKGLKKVGYKTSSKNPLRQLSTRLYTDKNLGRPSPGTFELKAKA